MAGVTPYWTLPAMPVGTVEPIVAASSLSHSHEGISTEVSTGTTITFSTIAMASGAPSSNDYIVVGIGFYNHFDATAGTMTVENASGGTPYSMTLLGFSGGCSSNPGNHVSMFGVKAGTAGASQANLIFKYTATHVVYQARIIVSKVTGSASTAISGSAQVKPEINAGSDPDAVGGSLTIGTGELLVAQFSIVDYAGGGGVPSATPTGVTNTALTHTYLDAYGVLQIGLAMTKSTAAATITAGVTSLDANHFVTAVAVKLVP